MFIYIGCGITETSLFMQTLVLYSLNPKYSQRTYYVRNYFIEVNLQKFSLKLLSLGFLEAQ